MYYYDPATVHYREKAKKKKNSKVILGGFEGLLVLGGKLKIKIIVSLSVACRGSFRHLVIC